MAIVAPGSQLCTTDWTRFSSQSPCHHRFCLQIVRKCNYQYKEGWTKYLLERRFHHSSRCVQLGLFLLHDPACAFAHNTSLEERSTEFDFVQQLSAWKLHHLLLPVHFEAECRTMFQCDVLCVHADCCDVGDWGH